MNILYICILLYVVATIVLLFLGKYYYILGLHKIGPTTPTPFIWCFIPVWNVIFLFVLIFMFTIGGTCTLVAYIADLAGIHDMYSKLKIWYNDNNLT